MSELDLSRRKFLGQRQASPGWPRSAARCPRRSPAPTATPGRRPSASGSSRPASSASSSSPLRDSITRRSIANSVANGLTPTRGYLGGPNFPADPTDLGPLVDLPGGFAETFEYLARSGLPRLRVLPVQPEHQRARPPANASRDPHLPRQCRSARRSAPHTGGLGIAHWHGGNRCTTRRLVVCPPAGRPSWRSRPTLGHTMIGTAGDPTGLATLANSATDQAGWTEMAHRANVIGQILADNGIRWYWHTEQNGWQFFTTPGLERTHRIDWWNANTDPGLVNLRAGHPALLRRPGTFPGPGRRHACGTRWASGRPTRTGSSAGTSRTAAGSCRRRRPA